MTWEIDLINPVKAINAVETLTNADLLPLGRKSDVLLVLAQTCPALKVPLHPDSPERGGIVGDDYHLEFYIPDSEPILMLGFDVVSGEEKAVLKVIHNICRTTGWRAFDPAQEKFINLRF